MALSFSVTLFQWMSLQKCILCTLRIIWQLNPRLCLTLASYGLAASNSHFWIHQTLQGLQISIPSRTLHMLMDDPWPCQRGYSSPLQTISVHASPDYSEWTWTTRPLASHSAYIAEAPDPLRILKLDFLAEAHCLGHRSLIFYSNYCCFSQLEANWRHSHYPHSLRKTFPTLAIGSIGFL